MSREKMKCVPIEGDGEDESQSPREPDGIYDERTCDVFSDVGCSVAEGGKQRADQNVFDWYSKHLPIRLDGYHILDWGAGLGRFVPLYLSRNPKRVTLIEPSLSAHRRLVDQYGNHEQLTIEKTAMGGAVPRQSTPPHTIHFCNFVVNCFDSPHEAMDCLRDSIVPNEKIYIATNVFVPNSMAQCIDMNDRSCELEFDVADVASCSEKPPTSRVFSNQILHTGRILRDSVHLIADYSSMLGCRESGWKIIRSVVMPPCGFKHVINEGDDYGEFTFVVMLLELDRIKDFG